MKIRAVVAGAVAGLGATALALTGVASASVGLAGAREVPAQVPWGRAIEIPGLAALNTTASVQEIEVSCASAGNCAVAGNYGNRSNYEEGFVVSERSGVWDKAIEIPGLAALNTGGTVQVFAVSCASAGNCAAGGSYRHHGPQGFVVSERNSEWGKAVGVPGLAELNTGGNAQVTSVSCASAGNCVAGGSYRHHGPQGFVVSERNGTWRKAVGVPGLAELNTDGNAQVTSVSCASAGNCAAGGTYTSGAERLQGFVTSERKGIWGKAIEIPGLGALNVGGGVWGVSVSCFSAGNCVAGGTYANLPGATEGFVASELHGAWGKAEEVPGLGTLGASGSSANSGVDSVSCAPAGVCAASGGYLTGSYGLELFVSSERNGAWSKAIEVPGLATLNIDRDAEGSSVSCGSASDCVIGGTYADDAGLEGFLTTKPRSR